LTKHYLGAVVKITINASDSDGAALDLTGYTDHEWKILKPDGTTSFTVAEDTVTYPCVMETVATGEMSLKTNLTDWNVSGIYSIQAWIDNADSEPAPTDTYFHEIHPINS